MNDKLRAMKPEEQDERLITCSPLVIRAFAIIRHSSFVIRHFARSSSVLHRARARNRVSSFFRHSLAAP